MSKLKDKNYWKQLEDPIFLVDFFLLIICFCFRSNTSMMKKMNK